VPHNYDLVFVIISVSRIHRLALIDRLGDIILARNNLTLISAKVATLIMRMCEGDLSHTKKGK